MVRRENFETLNHTNAGDLGYQERAIIQSQVDILPRAPPRGLTGREQGMRKTLTPRPCRKLPEPDSVAMR